MDSLLGFLVIGVIRLIRLLPLRVCFLLGCGVGWVLWVVLPPYRKLAVDNIRLALDVPVREAERLARSHFLRLGANGFSALKIPVLPEAEVAKVIEVEGIERMREAIAQGRGVLAAINHLGNWELYAHLSQLVPGARLGTVYQAIRNRKINDFIDAQRSAQGTLTFDRKKGFSGALALLREPGILGVLTDQNAGDGGIWMPFFGRLSSTSPLAASLALRTGAALIPASTHLIGFARWKVTIRPEIPTAGRTIEEITLDLNRVLESQIRESVSDWFWLHNRWKLPKPNFLIARQKRGFYLGGGGAPLKPLRLLVRSPNWLGDAVMAIPAVRAIHLGRHDVVLTVLCHENLRAVWERIAGVDRVITFTKGDSPVAVASRLRRAFDVAVVLPNSLRSALEVWMAGIPRRVGSPGHFRSALLNQVEFRKKKGKVPKPLHHADRYQFIAHRCGAPDPPPFASQWKPPASVVIGLCPGAEFGPAKQWPAASFRELMDRVSPEINPLWKVVGTRNDSAVAAKILDGFRGRAEDLTGQTSLDELIDVLCGLTVLVTNDTGTMHLADALGVPLLAIFGSTEPVLTGPRGHLSRVIRHHVPCSPCFLRQCPIDFRCMSGVRAEAVSHQLLGLIDQALSERVPCL